MSIRSFKKILVIVLALVIVTSVFSGCSNKNNAGSDDKSSTAVEAESATSASTAAGTEDKYAKYRPVKDKEYTIRVAGWLPCPVDNENGEVLKYYKEKLNVKVISENIDASKYAEILNLRIASGEEPDLFNVYYGMAAVRNLYDNKIILGFEEELFKTLAPNMYKIYETDLPGSLMYAKLDGKLLYGLPGTRPWNKYFYPVVWRGDWLKNVGIDKVPDTLEEMENALYKFTNEDPDRNGKNDTYGISTSGMNVVFGAFGYMPHSITAGTTMNWSVKDNKMVYDAVQPEMKQALAILQKWYKDGVIDPEFITGENKGGRGDITHAFINGRIGMTNHTEVWAWSPYTNSGNPGLCLNEFIKANPSAPEDAVIATIPPAGPDGKRGANQRTLINDGLWVFGSKLSKEPDKFGKILELLDFNYSSLENYLTSWFGIEGKHWKMENGLPIPLVDTNTFAAAGAYTTLAVLEPDYYQSAFCPPRNEWIKGTGFDKPYGISNALLSALPSAPKYTTELKKIEQETYISIIVGDKPIEYFDEFVKKWKENGGSILEKEANDWYSVISQ